jgi:hypothetical protein
MRRIISSAVAVLGTIALGALLGVLWEALAPRVTLVVAADGRAYPQGYQPGGYIDDAGIAAVICLSAGLALGLGIVWVTRRIVTPDNSHVVALVASVLLGALGALALWWVGERLGYVDLDALAAASSPGEEITAPLRLRMPGVLVLWPLASVLVVFIAAMGDWWKSRQARHE